MKLYFYTNNFKIRAENEKKIIKKISGTGFRTLTKLE